MTKTVSSEIREGEVVHKKLLSLKRLFFGIVVGCLLLGIIGSIQVFLVYGSIGVEIVLLFPLLLLSILFFYPMQFWLIFEIPWIIALFSSHKKKSDWKTKNKKTIYASIIGLAMLPVVAIQLLGIPQIPVITETILYEVSYFERTSYAHFVTSIQYLATYWLITKWFISWFYMFVLIKQPRTNQIKVDDLKEIQIIWFLWLLLLAILLCVNPVFIFMTFRL